MELKVQRRRDVRIGRLLKWKPDIHPDGLAASLVGPPVGRLHNPRPAPRRHHKPMPLRGNLLGPFRQHPRQPPRVFVVAGHLHRRHCPLPLQIRRFARRDLLRLGRLLLAGSGLGRPGVFKQLQRMVGLFAPAKPRRTKKHHRVLNVFPAKPRQRLHKLRHDANQTPVRAIQKYRILIRQRRALQRRRRPISRNRRRSRSCRSRLRVLLFIAHPNIPSPCSKSDPYPCSLFPIPYSLFPAGAPGDRSSSLGWLVPASSRHFSR